MFGEIMTRLSEGDKVMSNLAVEVRGLSKTIDSLPCNEHNSKIIASEEWIEKHDNQSEKIKILGEEHSLTLRNGVILILVTAFVNAVVSFGMYAILNKDYDKLNENTKEQYYESKFYDPVGSYSEIEWQEVDFTSSIYLRNW
jgi:hypothetical protein